MNKLNAPLLKHSTLLLLLATTLINLASCKKDTDDDDNGNPTDPVTVLNDGSGFSHVYDDVMVLSGITAGMDVMDFTLENSTDLHIAYYSVNPTQQSTFKINKRVTKNLSSGNLIELPEGADDLNYSDVEISQDGGEIVLEQFRPYTNYFTYGVLFQENAWPYSRHVEFRGDVTFSTMTTANPIGTPDIGYRFGCMNVSANAFDNGFGYFATGLDNYSYLYSDASVVPISIANSTPIKIVTSFLESDLYTYGSLMAFMVRTDSLVAYTYDPNTGTLTHLTGVSLSGLTGLSNMTTRRHYSADGNLFGMLIQDASSQQIWTVSYNFTSGTMTTGLQGVILDYSGEGSDYDLDEYGNVYYTGYAGNGSNTNGVSIYKKSTDGSVSLIGQDNVLKFGTVVKLKTLMGKVYFAVTGKKTGLDAYQLSIIKQD